MGTPVTIIGAGIVGICCALSLQARGMQVRLIDRGAPGQETSFGNAGVVSPWSIIPQAVPGIWKSIPGMLFDPSGPLSVRAGIWPKLVPWGLRFLASSGERTTRRTADAMEILCNPSIRLFRHHLEGTGHEDLLTDSCYVHAFRNAAKASLSDLGYVIRQEKGADLELVGSDALHRMEPALSRDFQAAIVIKGQARARAPGRMAQVLAEKVIAQGGEFVQANITALERTEEPGWVLRTSGVDISAQKIVLAAGVWSADLLMSAGISVPLLAERGYHVEFPHAAIELRNSVMDVDAKVVASSMEDGVRVAGTSEFAAIDAPPNPRKKKLLTRQARAMFPGLDGAGARFWMGRRPSFPDSLPALGEIRQAQGLFAAFGHSHYGLMMAPKTGELVADIIVGTKPNLDLSALDPQRF
ncbi:FAD-binding oxidoreductase [Roseobacter sp. YSTF-M11]|uniref:FAD-binding oxidoreductase n=1 Tax=Roseobacter insulae TaxID=2859783 RepID=A0A9X1FSQ8_9RHOB|nr:FAD-dependent oxidoreductase [Roseobacter insulae]MBW4707015.1 FAD-binding oxidoreductase [Roseobacter insulae]